MSASRSLFNQLLSRVVHAPLRWFDLVPLGTISNRFTNDVSGIDDEVARTMNMFTSNICRIITALVVSALVLPASLAFSFLFAVVYISIFRSYLLVNRDANRIASTTASPLFSSFAEALRGVVTIRAFAKQELYRSRLCHIVDETLAFWYLSATLDVRITDMSASNLHMRLIIHPSSDLAVHSDAAAVGFLSPLDGSLCDLLPPVARTGRHRHHVLADPYTSPRRPVQLVRPPRPLDELPGTDHRVPRGPARTGGRADPPRELAIAGWSRADARSTAFGDEASWRSAQLVPVDDVAD